MASAMPVDLRERFVAAIEAARRFEVNVASDMRWHGTFVQEGRTQGQAGGLRSALTRHQGAGRPDLKDFRGTARELFPHELRDSLSEQGLRAGMSSLTRFFECHGITRKKHRSCSRA